MCINTAFRFVVVSDALPLPVLAVFALRQASQSESSQYPDPTLTLKLTLVPRGAVPAAAAAAAVCNVHPTAPVVDLRWHLLRTVRCTDAAYAAYCESLCGCCVTVLGSADGRLPARYPRDEWHRAHVVSYEASTGERQGYCDTFKGVVCLLKTLSPVKIQKQTNEFRNQNTCMSKLRSFVLFVCFKSGPPYGMCEAR